jgi:hypothetical protein
MAQQWYNCSGCKGAKQVMGMGLLQVDCPTCDGSGLIDLETLNRLQEEDRIAEIKRQEFQSFPQHIIQPKRAQNFIVGVSDAHEQYIQPVVAEMSELSKKHYDDLGKGEQKIPKRRGRKPKNMTL